MIKDEHMEEFFDKLRAEGVKNLLDKAEPDAKPIVKVQFYNPGSGYLSKTIYEYFIGSDVKLDIGKTYYIENEAKFKYLNPVRVIGLARNSSRATHSIVKASLYNEIKTPAVVSIPAGIVPEKVVFDEEKGVTVILWTKDVKTILHLAPGDTFDKEKAIALGYMKLMMGNRSKFNEVIKKFCE